MTRDTDLSTLLLRSIIFIVVLAALLTIAQVWGIGLSFEDYIKCIATLGILAALMGFLMLARREMIDTKRLRDENYID